MSRRCRSRRPPTRRPRSHRRRRRRRRRASCRGGRRRGAGRRGVDPRVTARAIDGDDVRGGRGGREGDQGECDEPGVRHMPHQRSSRCAPYTRSIIACSPRPQVPRVVPAGQQDRGDRPRAEQPTVRDLATAASERVATQHCTDDRADRRDRRCPTRSIPKYVIASAPAAARAHVRPVSGRYVRRGQLAPVARGVRERARRSSRTSRSRRRDASAASLATSDVAARARRAGQLERGLAVVAARARRLRRAPRASSDIAAGRSA